MKWWLTHTFILKKFLINGFNRKLLSGGKTKENLIEREQIA